MSKEHTRECEGSCLFCQLVCPECGKWDGLEIDIDVGINLSLCNHTKGKVNIHKRIYDEHITVTCNNCGYELDENKAQDIANVIAEATDLDVERHEFYFDDNNVLQQNKFSQIVTTISKNEYNKLQKEEVE